jgi:hypothetical protein
MFLFKSIHRNNYCNASPRRGIFDLAFESQPKFNISRDARVIAAGKALNFEVLEPAVALARIRKA